MLEKLLTYTDMELAIYRKCNSDIGPFNGHNESLYEMVIATCGNKRKTRKLTESDKAMPSTGFKAMGRRHKSVKF